MTNPIETKISTFAKTEEAKVKAWFGSNLWPFLIGAACAGAVAWVIHLL